MPELNRKSKPTLSRRSLLRFSLRSVLVLIALAALAGQWWRQADRQRKIVNELESRKISVTYDFRYLLKSAARQLRLGSITRSTKLQRPAYGIGWLNEWDLTLSVG